MRPAQIAREILRDGRGGAGGEVASMRPAQIAREIIGNIVSEWAEKWLQ